MCLMNIGKSHLYMLESIMHQNAECKWLKEWNENIRFFHAMVEGGRKRNSLRGLHVEGVWEEDPIYDNFVKINKFSQNLRN